MSFERRWPRIRRERARRLTWHPGLVRFVPKGQDDKVLIGQPVDSSVDVGKAVRHGEEVQVKVFSGASALNPGSLTDRVEVISRVLSPLAAAEVGSIRCIGLNVGVALLARLRTRCDEANRRAPMRSM